MKKWFVRIGKGLLRHPVELIVLLCATVEVNVDPAELTVFAPFAVVASLSLSFYRHKRWANWVYWAVLPIYVLCVFLPAKWCEKPETWLLYALLVPAYLLARGGDFSKRLFSMVRSLVVSLGIGALTCLLLMLIYGSITMLFNTRGESYRTVMSFSFVLLAPMVFIGMESSKGEIKASKLEEVLVNWVLTIAVLIYNAVLYVYMLSILVQWELPKGMVATMVAVFMVILMGVRWLRPELSRQPLEWYFRWSGLLALPLVVLFWVATSYRIGQYGLTIDRCTLIASGVGMTVYAVASLFRLRRDGNYFMPFTVVMGLLLVCLARPLSIRSQTSRVTRCAKTAGVLTEAGKLQFNAENAADTVYRQEHRNAYQAMKYIENNLENTTFVRQRFGMTANEYLDHLSPKTYRYATVYRVEGYEDHEDYEKEEVVERKLYYVLSDEEYELPNLSDYSRLCTNIQFFQGKIIVGDNIFVADSVLATQLSKIGYTLESYLDGEFLNKHNKQLCSYRSPDGRVLMFFRELRIVREEDGNHLASGTFCCALLK